MQGYDLVICEVRYARNLGPSCRQRRQHPTSKIIPAGWAWLYTFVHARTSRSPKRIEILVAKLLVFCRTQLLTHLLPPHLLHAMAAPQQSIWAPSPNHTRRWAVGRPHWPQHRCLHCWGQRIVRNRPSSLEIPTKISACRLAKRIDFATMT